MNEVLRYTGKAHAVLICKAIIDHDGLGSLWPDTIKVQCHTKTKAVLNDDVVDFWQKIGITIASNKGNLAGKRPTGIFFTSRTRGEAVIDHDGPRSGNFHRIRPYTKGKAVFYTTMSNPAISATTTADPARFRWKYVTIVLFDCSSKETAKSASSAKRVLQL